MRTAVCDWGGHATEPPSAANARLGDFTSIADSTRKNGAGIVLPDERCVRVAINGSTPLGPAIPARPRLDARSRLPRRDAGRSTAPDRLGKGHAYDTQRRSLLGRGTASSAALQAISPASAAFRPLRPKWKIEKEKAPVQRQRAGTRRVSKVKGLRSALLDENPRLAGRRLSSKGDARAAHPCGASHRLASQSVAARVAFPSSSSAGHAMDSSLACSEPQSLQPVRAHPCGAQEENPWRRGCLSPFDGRIPSNGAIYGVHPTAAARRSHRGTVGAKAPGRTRGARRRSRRHPRP